MKLFLSELWTYSFTFRSHDDLCAKKGKIANIGMVIQLMLSYLVRSLARYR